MASPPTLDARHAARAAQRYLALTGPTASGKTAAAFAIARKWDVEIVSVDSALVYSGMDIGTAKPTPQELAQVPHHLINIRDPLNSYSAADFARDAARLIHDINQRGRLPLLVGGTMLYLKALWDGLDDLPQANHDLRALIETEASVHGWPALHADLAKIDPITAQRLAPNDSQRIEGRSGCKSPRARRALTSSIRPAASIASKRCAMRSCSQARPVGSSESKIFGGGK